MNAATLARNGQPSIDGAQDKLNAVPKTKRYNLVLPEDLFNELQGIADRRALSMVDVLRKFIQIGMIVDKVSTMPNAKVLIRENNVDREVMIV